MANTLKFGNGVWATKKGSTLAYNDENGNFKPLPFKTTRSTSATRVNKEGLIEVVSNDVPRIDYTDSEDGALLLEPSRTNLITYSEDFSQWSPGSSTIILNQGISPNGTLNADLVSSVSVNGNVSTSYTVLNDSLTTTQSIFVKHISGTSDFMLRGAFVGGTATAKASKFNLENGSVTSTDTTASIEYYGKGWYRVSQQIANNSSGNTTLVFQNFTTNDTVSTNELLLWGAQSEVSSYNTSYIPTNGQANGVTRVGDVCNNGANEQVINSTEGVLYVEMKSDFNDAETKRISISDFTNNNRLTLYFNVSTNLIGTVIVTDLGGSPSSLSYVVPSFSTYNKIALKYKTNDYALWVNGVEVDTELIGNTFAPNVLKTIRFEQGAGGLHYFYGNTKQIQYFNTALTDQELQALTI